MPSFKGQTPPPFLIPLDSALRAEDAQLGHRVAIQSTPQWHSNNLSLAFEQDLNAVNGLGVAIQTVSRWHSTWGLGARVSWVDAGRHRPRKARARVPRNHVGSLDTSSMASAQRWHARIEKKSRCSSLRKWNGTEKISMASAQGKLQQNGCRLQPALGPQSAGAGSAKGAGFSPE